MVPSPEIENHPFPPFCPPGAKVLIMGTFPPGRHRWAMDFYYPNRTNDFWKIMGLIFLNDVNALYNPATGQYDLPAIIELMTARGIALNDTARQVRRLRGTASDKFLEMVTPVPLDHCSRRCPSAAPWSPPAKRPPLW